MRTFHLQIISPEGSLFEGEAGHISAPGLLGSFGILVDHEPFCTALTKGSVSINCGGNGSPEKKFLITGGIFHFDKNKAILLADEASLCE